MLTLVLIGCGSPSSDPFSATIGPEGGSLLGPDGVRLDVPAGAVSAPTRFSIARVTERPELDPLVAVADGAAYRFEPRNTEFALDLRVTIPVTSSGTGELVGLRRPDSEAEWTAIGSAPATSSEVVLYTRHFTLLELARLVTSLSMCFELGPCDAACTISSLGLPSGCTGSCSVNAIGGTAGLSCAAEPVGPDNPQGTVFLCQCTEGSPRPYRIDAVVAGLRFAQAVYGAMDHCGVPCAALDAGMADAGPRDAGADAGADDAGLDTGAANDAALDTGPAIDGGTGALVDDALVLGAPMLTPVATRTVGVDDFVNDAVASSGSVFAAIGPSLLSVPYGGAGGFTTRSGAAATLENVGGYVYFGRGPSVAGGADASVRRIDATTFAEELVVATGMSAPIDVEVNATHLFYLEGEPFGRTRIYRLPLAMPTSSVLYDTNGADRFEIDGAGVYYGIRVASPPPYFRIERASLTLVGGGTPLFADGATGDLDEMYVRALDATHVYFVAAGFSGTAPLRLYRAATAAAGAPEILATFGAGFTLLDVEVVGDDIWLTVSGASAFGVLRTSRTSPTAITAVGRTARRALIASDGTNVFAVDAGGTYRLAP